MSNIGPTRLLSEFVAGARAKNLPADVIQQAKGCVLDTIAAMVLGAAQPWSQIVIGLATGAGGAGGACTVVGDVRRSTPQMAALANGNMGHALEIDDVHDESLTHPGVVVVPAAMAVAEERSASGADFLSAIVLGYELAGRSGLAVGAVSHMLRGFYPTGTGAVFGAAAAAGKLLGLGPNRLANAFGVAGSFASGINEGTRSGDFVKWLHAGRAAEGGVTAAYLAEGGFTGPKTVFEGPFGFCRAFSDEPDVSRLVHGLGDEFVIRNITVKPYACCSDIHPVIEAVGEIASQDGVDPAQIRSVHVESTTKLLELNNIDGTASIMAAKYSVPFTVALVLMHDIQDPSIYCEAILTSAELRTIQDTVTMSASQEFDSLYPRTIGARVTMELLDGRRLVAANFGAAGSINRPLTEHERNGKFMKLVGPLLGPAGATELMSQVEDLDGAVNILCLTERLRFEATRAGATCTPQSWHSTESA